LLNPVCYDNKIQKEVFKDILITADIETSLGENTDYDFSHNVYKKLLKVAPFIKAGDFSHEKEWRIVIKAEKKKAEFREGGFAFIPYYKQKISENAIDKITIGLCIDFESTRQSVDFLCNNLYNNNYPAIEKSNVLYK
jgi:hypothetical protein